MEVRNLTKRPNGLITFEIVFSGPEWEKPLAAAALAWEKKKPIPGYRIGKAPLALACRTYGNAMVEEAANEVLTSSLPGVLKEQGLEPVSPPQIRPVQADSVSLLALCSLINHPDVPDFDYLGLPVERPVHTCTEDDIDKAVDDYMDNHLYVHEVDRPAAMGDIAEVDFTGTHNGKKFDYDHSARSRFTMGSGILFAGLDEALVGHSAGDHLSLRLTMPEDFHRAAVQGLTLDLEVNLHGVWARERVACTDEYVKENVPGCETVQEFRARQRQTLMKRYDSAADRAFEKNVEAALASRITCDVPEALYEAPLRRLVSARDQAAVQEGLSPDETPEEKEARLAGYRAKARPEAEAQVKTSLALESVIRRENIRVTEEEIDSHLVSCANALQITPQDALKRLGGKDAVANHLRQEKALDLVCRHADVTRVEAEEIPG